MKKLIIITCMASFLAIGCDNNKTTKDETMVMADTSATPNSSMAKADEMVTTPVDSATKMKNWMAYMTPGDVHKMMASWNGTWQGDITMWEVAGAPPHMSKGTCTYKMLLGGRYQVGNFSGNMMGQPFEGVSTLAYDNAKKVFISSWVDNMGTGIMTLEGTWDEASKTINFAGKGVDPTDGTGKDMAIRETFKVIDDKNQFMEMYGPGPDGKEFKMMEIKYTRK